jgi:hypothetical protein
MGIFDNKRIGRVNRALLRENGEWEKYGDYPKALAAAGAVIHAHERFGDYQGTWLALVTYGRETGWIKANFGSCSGCDAFEAEFGYGEPTFDQLADFGETYLGALLDQKTLEEQLKEDSWDSDSVEMLKFVQANRDIK